MRTLLPALSATTGAYFCVAASHLPPYPRAPKSRQTEYKTPQSSALVLKRSDTSSPTTFCKLLQEQYDKAYSVPSPKNTQELCSLIPSNPKHKKIKTPPPSNRVDGRHHNADEDLDPEKNIIA